MRTIILAILLVPCMAVAQIVKPKTSVISVGAGAGIYTGNNQLPSAFLLPISIQHNISNRVSIGAQYQHSRYWNLPDSAGRISEKVKSFVVGGRIDYHFKQTEYSDWFAGVVIGYHNLSHEFITTHSKRGILIGDGLTLQAQAGYRRLISEGLGVYGCLTLPDLQVKWTSYQLDGRSVDFSHYKNYNLRGAELKVGVFAVL